MGIKRSVLIRQSDLSCRKALDKNKIWSKIQKTKNKIFPLYFWPKCFVNLILKCWYLKWLQFKRNFLCSLYTHRHKLSISNFREYLKFLFFDTLFWGKNVIISCFRKKIFISWQIIVIRWSVSLNNLVVFFLFHHYAKWPPKLLVTLGSDVSFWYRSYSCLTERRG